MARPRPRLLLAVLLGIHLAWVAGRVPHAVTAKRIAEVRAFETSGDCAFYLDGEHLSGADAVAWVRSNTTTDAAILFDGDRKGSMEFAPFLLFPRLLVDANAVPSGATEHGGRPIAHAERDGRRARIVLVGRGTSLELELR
ncbi:MAG: hypothetical protein HZB39_07560 [Planctomycetes bacterium]|nr:hypothetical protein [Planctomycetota bacterium]